MRASDIKDYKYERECKDDEMLNRSSRRARKAHKILFYTHGFSSQVGWNDYARILPTAHLLHWNKNNVHTMQKYATHKLFYIAKDGDDDDVCGEEEEKKKKWINFLFIFIIIPPLFLSLLTIRFLFMALVTHMTAAMCSLMNEWGREK